MAISKSGLPKIVMSGVIGLSILLGMVGASKGQTKPTARTEGFSQMSIDLSKYTLVLNENFNGPLNIYNGTSGIWSTAPSRGNLVTNGPQSVFVSEQTKTSDGKGVGLNPLNVKDGVLHIGSGVIPDANKAAVNDALRLVGQDQFVGKSKYYTGMISTGDTWGQTYGYYEIRAQVPEGKGHWSAFWLEPASVGWPPEIDIFEAYGRGVDKRTKSDNVFNSAVFFDEVDVNGNRTQKVDIDNPYLLDANGRPQEADARTKAGGEQYVFNKRTNAMEDFGADIYNEFWTWAVDWTPESITFYFGKDHNSLREVYKTPTPEDLNSAMTMIANDQISSTWGWNPVTGFDHLTFAEGNDLKIDYIKAYALNPERSLRVDGNATSVSIVDTAGTTRIRDTAGSDKIVTGNGEDMIDLRGGADTVFVQRGVGNKIINGFGSNDKLVLEGFYVKNVADALARLTQVGNDVWLANGAEPKDPQTIAFKDAKVSDFTAANFEIRWSVTPDIWASRLHDEARVTKVDADGVVRGAATGSKISDAAPSPKATKTLMGSNAGDEFFVHDRDTRVVERAGGGVDTVFAFTDFALPDHVENITAGVDRSGLSLTGNALDNRLEGAAGAEIFRGGRGNDLIVAGGAGNRIVYAAGDGHDTIAEFSANDVVVLEGIRFQSFGQLSARLVASGLDTVLDLGNGQSITFRGTTIDKLGAANFQFEQGTTVFTGKGFDPFYMPSVSSTRTVYEPPAPDVDPPREPVKKTQLIDGTGSADVINAANNENHEINGDAGNDQIRGRGGDDLLHGGDGDDVLQGMSGQDTLLGGEGNDTLNGNDGNDTLNGDAGNDVLNGHAGNDVMYGGDGEDRLTSGDGSDVLHGENGNDNLVAGKDADVLYGGLGNDNLSGDDGNDRLFGGAGNDTLKGGNGDDMLDGGLGLSRLMGEDGADVFVITGRTNADLARILDFSAAEGDSIDLSALIGGRRAAFADHVQLVETRAGVNIMFDDDGRGGSAAQHVAMVTGVTSADLSGWLMY